MKRNIDQLAINTIRTLSIDAIEQAQSGHPGMPMGAAPMAYTLWTRFLKHNPANPHWFNRDRFVLSAGHGSMLLYSLLYLSGYDLTLDEVKQFRQWKSKTPGHPEFGHTPGVEATTGPLGQGIGMAVGMAMAERHLASIYNRDSFAIIDHYTYVLCGDGDLMEGISYEAASLAGHLKLGRLIVLYDSNDISLDGKLSHAFNENIRQRFEACGWQYLRVEDGNDPEEIARAIEEARREKDKPSLIEVRTVIGYGSPNKAGKSAAHGAPLGKEEAQLTKERYGWPHAPFHVPEEVKAHFEALRRKGEEEEQKWVQLFKEYEAVYPELARQLKETLEEEWTVDGDWPAFEVGAKVATREASEKMINALASRLPALWGGSADLASSTKTLIKGEAPFSAEEYGGRNIWFGVREHAMGACMNGIALHGGTRVYGGTFLVFSDYLRPAIRLAALQGLPVVYVFTHDSIAVGEDGPTHQPIEQLPSLRLIPGLTVIRPADAHETEAAWLYSIAQAKGPVALILTRQGLPVLEETKQNRDALAKGAYVLAETEGKAPDIILMASGSEVSLILEAKRELEKEGWGVRVVSMPSWELFEQQDEAYKQEVLPPSVTKRLAVEMAHPLGWERYVGSDGAVLGIATFGASAPGKKVMEEFGFTLSNVVEKAKGLLQASRG